MRKRILSTILAAAMVLSVMTAPAFAADGTLKAGDSITVEHAGDGSKHVFTYQSAKGINVFEISDSTPSERDYPFGYIDFADRYCMNSVIYNGKQVQFYQFDDEATHEMTWLTFGGDEGFVAAETYTISTSALEESGSYVLECGENQYLILFAPEKTAPYMASTGRLSDDNNTRILEKGKQYMLEVYNAETEPSIVEFDEELKLNTTDNRAHVHYKFVPKESGTYSFSITRNDVGVELYDADGNSLKWVNNGDEYHFDKDTVYYIMGYDDHNSGDWDFSVSLKSADAPSSGDTDKPDTDDDEKPPVDETDKPDTDGDNKPSDSETENPAEGNDEEQPEDEPTPETPAITFTDVDSNAYYADAVAWAVANGITQGTSDTTFSPDAGCTRAQVVTFLWRAAGSPESTVISAFTDVAADSDYAQAVAWAVENGITFGTGADTFNPNGLCNRAQIVTFLARFANGKASTTENPFDDVSGDAFYTGAVQWAVENNITNGTSDTTFSPDDTCTRGQVVVFLYRYMGE